ncbi:UDP-N-acetylmuramate--L-alanine ligase, partial [Candidatus Sumerlaeota bacterium]|nr:UDP-N-acetylmuramate--L-alanine ligase [Candidatus Sumerlaeota bacterium]
ITIIDDYAHHPTEIKATLAAARSSVRTAKGRRIVGVFQPHRYSRTANLAHEFGGAFREADMIVVTDVYAAGEDPIEGVSGNNIYAQVVADGHPAVYYIPRTTDVSDFLRSKLSAGDMVFTLGAGDVWRLGESLLEDLKNNDKPPLAA